MVKPGFGIGHSGLATAAIAGRPDAVSAAPDDG